MDWIHCNSCFKQPRISVPGRKFFLTSCGHVYCNTCLNSKPVEEKCIVCGNTYKSVPLNEEMKPDVAEYFKDVESSVKKMAEVMVFQNGHRQRLAAHSKLVDDKYAAAKEEVKRLYEINKVKDKKIQELDYAMKFYKKKFEDVQSASARPPVITPRSGGTLLSKLTPSPMLPGSMAAFSQRFLQSSQGKNQSGERIWVTPNRLTLQYKPMSMTTPTISVNPSPDSSMTPSRSSKNISSLHYRGYRNNYPHYSTQPTPVHQFVSPAVPANSPNTPMQASYYPSPARPRPNAQHRSQYYDSSVPSKTPPNLSELHLNSQHTNNEQQKK